MNPDELATHFPAWLSVIFAATTFGSVIFWFASRAARREREKLLRDTISDQRVRISELEKERDMYREQKHLLAQDAQASKLKIVELESRPDLGRILEKEEEWHERRQEFYKKLFELMEKMNHRLDEELKNHSNAFSRMADSMVELTRRLEQKKVI